MTFGAFISTRRKEAKLNLRDTAKHLGISNGYLCDIEQGRRKPFGSDKIEKFCEYLHLTDADKALMYDLAKKDRRHPI